MDVIGAYRLWSDPIAVASCGTSLTPQHMTLLKRHTSTIYLCFDTDDAGVDATIRALGLCYEQGIYPHVLTLPDGCKDIDDLAEQGSDEMVDGLPAGITKHE